MQNELPLVKDLVLIGGGHTHALVLKRWGMQSLAGVRVTLINPDATAAYSGMLPGFVSGHYTRDDLDYDLVKLTRYANARLIVGYATAIDTVARTVTVPGRPPIHYDAVSIDIGITSDMPALPGFADHGIPAKPLGTFATRWDAFRTTTTDPHVAIIGGGVAGAELAMAMAFSLRKRSLEPVIHLIDRGKIVDNLGDKARVKMLSALAQNGVTLVEDASVTGVAAMHVELGDGREIRSDFTTGAAGARPHGWQADIGVDLHDGFIAVGPTLQSSDPTLFATGDCAHLTHAPRSKAGVYAVRQAPVLFDNLRALLSDGQMRDYQPQKDYLKLISLGQKSALAERFGTAFSGPLLWRWKDHIDRKFMGKFDDLAMMGHPDIPRAAATGLAEALGDKPICGGCGAKVGRGTLTDVLAGLPATDRDDVVAVPGDDAAMLQMGDLRQVISTDHLRAFTNDPVAMTRIAACHALGDIWAMGAKPQAATISIILPRLSTTLQRRWLKEIMVTANAVMAEAGAAIVGGHTSVGAEFTVGFTITGLCDSDPITLRGAMPGDKLILTKPLGTGVVMAADMAGVAHGDDVIAALGFMGRSQARASTILQAAHAMTDVTGFGLAGHLNGICTASGVGAMLELGALPLLSGASDLAAAGTQSSLFPDNVAGAGPISGPPGPRYDLLFDPQTAGGLLAAVPADQAQSLLDEMLAAGETAALIGGITAGLSEIKAR